MSFTSSFYVASKAGIVRRRRPNQILLLLATWSFLTHSHSYCVAQNLIINGDFSQGNLGFTSGYTFSNNWVGPAGTYTIGTDPTLFHSGVNSSFGDHTTGEGLMMIVNGATTPDLTVWQQIVDVVPNTTYNFSAWATEWGHTNFAPNYASLRVVINGTQIVSNFATSGGYGAWTQFAATWNSGFDSSATIRIVNINVMSGGNDFSLDDLAFTVVSEAEIASSYFYHAAYTGSGTPPWNRLDNSKILVKEGTGPQLLTFDNLINTSQGINGIVFDIENLPDAGNLSVEDFEFQMSPTGAFDGVANPPANWQSAPAPSSITVTTGSPDRVLIQWPDQSIMNRWLRITVLANEETGLAQPETYYIGHLLGETTGPSDGTFTVSFADITSIRAEVGQTVDASSITDIDKNGTVSFADISAMRGNVGSQLTQISVP